MDKRIVDLLSSCDSRTFSDYLSLSRRIEETAAAGPLAEAPSVKIAVLSSFTMSGIREVLRVKCCEAGIFPQFYLGAYNQIAREILEPRSGLYGFDPDFVIIFMDVRSLLGDLFFNPYRISDEDRRKWAEAKAAELEGLVRGLREHSRAPILIHNFEVPLYSPLGILENKRSFGFVESLQYLNGKLRELAKEERRIFVFDYDAFASRIGKENVLDEKMYYLGDVKLAWRHMASLGDAYLAYLKPFKSLIRKCIVLDLDNTLWGGIVGEEGLEGIRLGPTREGRPYMEFQQHLLALSQRGILLAVNSLNNPEDAWAVIRKHPHMVLREGHFASVRINWDDKISNLKSIAEELGLGTDSLVFIDDDRANRDLVRRAFPEVRVVDLPEDPWDYPKTLRALNEFHAFQLTDEDRRRGELYAAERRRAGLSRGMTLDEYLKALETVVSVREGDSFGIPRIAQLTQRTNQFNLTSRRYQEDAIRRLAEEGRYGVWSLGARDKFGDNGIVGAAIVEKSGDTWRIETFLVSCRVIGRRIEDAFLAEIVNEAARRGAKRVLGEFAPTPKNAPAKGFYERCGFCLVRRSEDREVWEYDTAVPFPFPVSVRRAAEVSV